MQLNQTLRSLVGQSVQGTFGVQLLLRDHATEETLAAIQRTVDALYQRHVHSYSKLR